MVLMLSGKPNAEQARSGKPNLFGEIKWQINC